MPLKGPTAVKRLRNQANGNVKRRLNTSSKQTWAPEALMMSVAQPVRAHTSPFSNDESIIDAVVIRRYSGPFTLNTGSREAWFTFAAPIATFKHTRAE